MTSRDKIIVLFCLKLLILSVSSLPHGILEKSIPINNASWFQNLESTVSRFFGFERTHSRNETLFSKSERNSIGYYSCFSAYTTVIGANGTVAVKPMSHPVNSHWLEGRFVVSCQPEAFIYTKVVPVACLDQFNNVRRRGEQWYEGRYRLRCEGFWASLRIKKSGWHPDNLSPIIIVPGAGGSRMLAKLNKTSTVSKMCAAHTGNDSYQLWPSISAALPAMVDCWVDNAKLYFDETTGQTRNSDGVEITIPGFGSTDSIEYYIDYIQFKPTAYFNKFVTTAADEWGYVKCKNIKAAPYDFRKAPDELGDYFVALKQLIETSYNENNRQRVTIVTHSLGGPMLLYFFQRETQAWKDQHINSLVTLGAPLSGTMIPIYSLASGYGYLPILPSIKLRTAERTWPGIAFGFPAEPAFPKDEPIVFTAQRNYTVADYRDFYHDIGYDEGLKVFESKRGLLDYSAAPNVQVHCIVGTGKPTPAAVAYKLNEFPDHQPTAITADGDETVTRRSAELCKQWSTKQSHQIHYQEFANVGHLEMVWNDDVIEYIRNVVTPVE